MGFFLGESLLLEDLVKDLKIDFFFLPLEVIFLDSSVDYRLSNLMTETFIEGFLADSTMCFY